MKQKIGRRLSALVVAAAMSVLMLPATAMATDYSGNTESTDAVASITSGGTTYYYTTLAAAIADATGGETVTLLANVTTDSTITVSGNVVLDLGEYSIKTGSSFPNAGCLLDVSEGATLTVTGSGEISGAWCAIRNYGTLTISDGTISGTTYGVLQYSGATTITGGTIKGSYGVELQGGTLSISGGAISTSSRGINLLYDSTATISGGTISSPGSYHYGIMQLGSSKVTISGGEITGGYGIQQQGGTLTISDGTIKGTSGDGVAIVSNDSDTTTTITGGTITGNANGVYITENNNKTATVEISGGTITGNAYGVKQQSGTFAISGGTITGTTGAVYQQSETPTITGGTFNTDINAYLVAGYVLLYDESAETGSTYTAMTEAAAQASDATVAATYTDVEVTYYYLSEENVLDGQTISQYKVTFVNADEERTVVSTEWVASAKNVTAFPEAELEGYNFTGWSYAGTTYTTAEEITAVVVNSALTFAAEYTPVEDETATGDEEETDTTDSDDTEETIASTGDDTNVLVFGAIALLAASGAFVARKKLFVK